MTLQPKCGKKGVPNLNVSWVKAHQDNKTPIDDLPLDAVLNCKVDKDAESFQLTACADLRPKLTPPALPLTKVYLVLNNTVITNNLRQQLEENYESINIKNTSNKKQA
jgi:hypothetical protein